MSAETQPPSVNVEQIVQQIREQVQQRMDAASPKPILPYPHTTPVLEVPGELVRGLRSLTRDVERHSTDVGQPTPAPPTIRGRIGSIVMRLLGRFLWWYTFQLQSFISATLRLYREQIKVIETLSDRIDAVRSGYAADRQADKQVDKQLASDITRLKQDTHAWFADEVSAREELEQRLSRELRLLAPVTARVEELEQRLASESQRLSRESQQLAQQLAQVGARVAELGLYTHQTRTQVSLQERRISLLIEEARKRLPEPFSDEQLRNLVGYNRQKDDSIYAAFEDVFRGSREDIKNRQSVYLPLLQQHNIGSSWMPVLDLGCGRGEWLELLRESSLQASGLDRNDAMIERCRALDLDVTQGDALRYLGNLPGATLGAVTAFHLVEHLPFDTVLDLVDEALRTLKSGGLLILETPNPLNILVGAHNFYLDPTHLRPLPSGMLRFFVEARGFCNVQVKELHPYPESVRLPEDGLDLARRFNDYFYGPQDYAVIGQKP